MSINAPTPRMPSRLLAISLGVLMSLTAAYALPASADAKRGKKGHTKVLRHKKTKFRVRAPRDFKLKYYAKTGLYVISSRRRRARVSYLRLKSDSSAKDAGNAFIDKAGAKVIKKKTETDKRFVAKIKRKKRHDTVDVRRNGSDLVMTVYGAKKKKKKRRKRARATAAASLNALLRRIAAAARGGRLVELPQGTREVPIGPVPLEPYTAPDGKAKAQVPAGDGWWRSGANGAIEGYNEAQGEYLLGLGALIAIPGTCAFYPNVPCVESDYLNPDDALRQIYPQIRKFAPGSAVTNVQIEEIHPVVLPGYSSALYVASFIHGGVPWKGAFLIGTTSYTGGSYWLMYISMISVPLTDNSSVAQALVQTWQSWDPSVAIQDRLNKIDNQIKATTEIIQEVTLFKAQKAQEAFEKWDDYIRM